jgi:predicted CopG family antitoxin
MRRKITLTIDSDVYDSLEELPRKVSVSEFVNFMLKAYIEAFKRGGMPSDEQVDEIVAKMGGEEFRDRLRDRFPSLNAVAQVIKRVVNKGGCTGSDTVIKVKPPNSPLSDHRASQ